MLILANLSVGVTDHLPRSELKRQSKVPDAGGHVTLGNYISGFAMMRRRGTLMRTFLDLKSLWAIAGFRP